MASSPHTLPGANMCACWHGKQPPSWRVAWQPPSPYLEDLTKTLVIAPPVRRRLQLVPAVRLKTASVSPYEPPRDAASRASRYIRARLQLELAEHHNRILWEREAHANASELGMDIHTYNMLLSMQHRDITPEDYEVLGKLDASLKPKTLDQAVLDELMPAWRVPSQAGPPFGGEAGEEAKEKEGKEKEGKEKEGTDAEAFTCSVCLSDLMPGEIARTLPCKHRFHMSCIDAWLTENSHVCPADGLPVLPDTAT